MNDKKNDQAAESSEKDSGKVNIQPSESGSGDENNAPGRTPGKAEGSAEVIEQDLRDGENDKR